MSIREISRRYFFDGSDTAKNDITHHSDCMIYSCRHFCDCGLIHDLISKDWVLANILYEHFERDYFINEGISKPEKDKGLMAAEYLFGKMPNLIEEEIDYKYGLLKKTLNEEFSQTLFPKAYERLEVWRKKNLAKI